MLLIPTYFDLRDCLDSLSLMIIIYLKASDGIVEARKCLK